LAPLDGEPAAVAGRLAFHLEKAGRPAEAATYAEMAAERALSLAASTQAAFFYRQALRLEPTPARLMGLGQALQLQGQNVEARETLVRALAAFSAADDTGSAARACLALAETYLGSGSSDLLIEWAERAVQVGGDAMGPELYAHVHFLLGAGTLRTEPSLAVAESHLLEAARLATTNNLAYIGVQSRFELGNLFAERGDLTAAVATFQEVITLAQQHNNPYQEVLGYNNLAYHAALAGDLALAHEAIEHGLALADNYSFHLPRLYLYSSRGEIALIEERFAEAESWFQRALKEAGEAGDALQMANLEANLGRVAHRRGELDEALTLLEAARQAVTGLTAEHLEVQIDVWLAELYLERGEHAATSESLQRALARLEGSGRQMLLAAVKRISGGIHSSFSL
jgi:tetratricopeptide (TPR) repeat protein